MNKNNEKHFAACAETGEVIGAVEIQKTITPAWSDPSFQERVRLELLFSLEWLEQDASSLHEDATNHDGSWHDKEDEETYKWLLSKVAELRDLLNVMEKKSG